MMTAGAEPYRLGNNREFCFSRFDCAPAEIARLSQLFDLLDGHGAICQGRFQEHRRRVLLGSRLTIIGIESFAGGRLDDAIPGDPRVIVGAAIVKGHVYPFKPIRKVLNAALGEVALGSHEEEAASFVSIIVALGRTQPSRTGKRTEGMTVG